MKPVAVLKLLCSRCGQGEDGLQGPKGPPGRAGNRGRGVSTDPTSQWGLRSYQGLWLLADFCLWFHRFRETRAGRENRASQESQDIQDTG